MKKYVLILFVTIAYFISSISSAQSSNWIWAKGSNGDGEGIGAATDRFGNVFATGYFEGYSTFGAFTLSNSGNADVFIAKYDSLGNVLWAKQSSGTIYHNESAGVATDTLGNVYITGYFTSPTITFGSYTLTNTYGPGGIGNIFLTKYDSSGNVLWAKSAGKSGAGITDSLTEDISFGVATDNFGSVYIAGGYNTSSITFDADTLTNTVNSKTADLFLVKYNSSGNVIWAKSVGGIDDDGSYSVATNASSGNIYITGRFFSPTISFGTHALTNTNSTGATPDIFIVKYDSTGNVIWTKSAGNTDWETANSVTADLSENAYVTGGFNSDTLMFGTYLLTNLSGGGNIGNFFLTKWDSSGNVLFAKSGGGTNIGYEGHCTVTDVKRNVYVTGHFNGSAPIFDYNSVFFSPGWDPFFIVKYDSAGSFLCASALQSGGDDLSGVAVDRFCNAYIVGDLFTTPIVIGTTTLTLSGGENVFVAKFRADCANTDAIYEIAPFEKLIIYPNPTSDNIIISSENELSTISIINSLGEVVSLTKSTKYTEQIDVSKLVQGVYFFKITDANNVLHAGKFIIAN